MLTPKQIKIFEAFLRNPYQELTYKEIKDYSKEKSNSIIQIAVVKFLAEDLVKKREVGNIILYALNIDNSAVFSYFDRTIKHRFCIYCNFWVICGREAKRKIRLRYRDLCEFCRRQKEL